MCGCARWACLRIIGFFKYLPQSTPRVLVDFLFVFLVCLYVWSVQEFSVI